MESKRVKRKWIFSGWEIVCMALPLAVVGSPHFSTAPLAWAIYATGRANGCSLERSLAAQDFRSKMYVSVKQFNETLGFQSFDGQDLIKWTSPWGPFWAPKATSIPFLLSEQILRVYGDGPRRVQPGDVVIDCGANVGTFTREALMAGASKVVAVEPSTQNVECLRRTFAKEIAEGRVVVYPKGVWHREENLEMFVYDNSALDSFVMDDRPESDRKPKKFLLPVTTVDKIVAELNLSNVDFIKMDIEGAERHALRGAAGTIGKMKPRLAIATENLPDDPQVVRQVVKEIAPAYQEQCGPCQFQSTTVITPDIFYFYPLEGTVRTKTVALAPQSPNHYGSPLDSASSNPAGGRAGGVRK